MRKMKRVIEIKGEKEDAGNKTDEEDEEKEEE